MNALFTSSFTLSSRILPRASRLAFASAGTWSIARVHDGVLLLACSLAFGSIRDAIVARAFEHRPVRIRVWGLAIVARAFEHRPVRIFAKIDILL